MEQPIPVYLLALIVGDVVSRDLTDRIRVWTEPVFLDAAAAEFDDVLPRYLQTAERLYGPYLWERYDIVAMPTAFPWGGMENARLTTLSNTLIAGDKSLTSVCAHEISHSWFGNLVTNANWSEFWLNEGFTMYAERRLTAEVHGQDYSNISASLGETLLREEVEDIGVNNSLTKLRPPVDGDPDDTYNLCPYEKGFAFLIYLKNHVGSFEEFDKFLKSYVAHFKFQSVVAEDFFGPGVGFQDWLNQPGHTLVPLNLPPSPRLEAAKDLFSLWEAASPLPPLINVNDERLDFTKFITSQKCSFLDYFALAKNQRLLTADFFSALDALYHLSAQRNLEVQLRWTKMLVVSNLNSWLPTVRDFIMSTGKQKHLVPVFRLLCNRGDPIAKKFAADVFSQRKKELHILLQAIINNVIVQS